MEVFTGKLDANADKPSVLPVRATSSATPHQPPLLETSSDYDVWKFKMTAYLHKVPLSEHFHYLVSYPSTEAFKRVTAYGFAASNSLAENWTILDDCFSLPVDTQQLTIQFLSRYQKAGDNLSTISTPYSELLFKLFSNFDVTGREELVRSRFVKGLAHGPLREHLLRMPPVNTSDLKRTAIRFITAERLTSSSAAQQQPVMTVDSTIEPNRADNFPKATAFAHIRTRGISTGWSNSTWNRQSSWNSYHGRRTECVYCRRFGRNARRCGHNGPHNPDLSALLNR